ncbi:hypothetical protein GJ496_002755 [Pomphorhynchus laevis]|nr:hypothetical protein GJ496_002755 [Pomphorhynchus laevis]
MKNPEAMDLTPPLIREALTMVIASKVSSWTCNHHVGTACGVGYITKLLSSFGNGVPDETKRSAVHSAGHCAGTLRILRRIGIAGIKDVANIHEAGDVRFSLTDDFKLHTLGLPAGANKLSIGYAILQRLIKNPVMRAVPGPADFIALAEAYHTAMNNRVRYHIGSFYLTGYQRITEHDKIMSTTLGRLGSFIAVNYAATSLAKSPSIEATGREGAALRYQNYEDFDEEWHRLLIEVRRAKVSEN